MSRFVLTAQLQLQAPSNVSQVVRQIQSQLNNVNVNVQVQGAQQAQRQIQQVTQNTNNATSAADRMGRAFAVSVRRFAAFSIATRAVGLFTSTLSDAVQTAIDFERQMIKVSQVTGESIGRLRGLTSTITDLSTGLGVSSQSLLEVSTVLLQAGVSSKDTTVALKTLAKAALAPNFDGISETAEGAIAILAQFQEGVGSLEKQLGSINAVAGAFAVEAGDLIDVIRRTGGVFKASGGSLNELLALFTSVRATTRESAESIGTGLRTIFTRIQRPKTIEFLKQFGVELVDLNGKFVGPFEAVKRLSSALSGLGEGDLTFIRIAEELGGFRQIGKVLPLLQQFSTAQAALNVAQNAGNSLTKDAETAQASLAIRITKVREEFLALVRSVTETTTFQVMANTALTLASALINVADSLKGLLPLLGALAAVKIARGLGSFVGGISGGLTSGRTFNKGGKVLAFARGGMVPGTGNRDTVPAMLSPGEFVIRKSSVNKLGAANLAAMNENRYAMGGTVGAIALNPIGGEATGKGKVTVKDILSTLSNNNQLAGGISGNLKLTDKTGKLQKLMERKEAPNGLSFGERLEKLVSRIAFNGKNYQNFTTKGASFPSTKDSDSSVEQGIKTSLTNAYKNIIPNVASQLASSVGLPTAIGSFNQSIIKSIGLEDTTGKIFEAAVSSLGAPFDANKGKQDRDAFDFPMGIGSHLGQFKAFSDLADKPTDAKKTLDSTILNDIASRKTRNTLAEQVNTSGAFQALKKRVLSMEGTSKGRSEFDKPRGPRKKFFGGLIQKFAAGGMAQAPLIDDIINASGTLMPRPSSAIAALIKAGGGAIDIDRTLKRTIGDKAYGMAQTSGQQSAALDKYFRDPQARLNDVRSAPLTVFGKELQAAIKSGQLKPGKLSVISKSQRVPGIAEYLNQLFGIPLANMIFTQGGSKQPAMDALRAKGPRSTRVSRFAEGGQVYKRGSLIYGIDDMKEAAKRKGITFDQLKAMLEERQDNAFQDFVIAPHEVSSKFGLTTYKPPNSAVYEKTMAAKFEKEDRIESWRQKQGLATREYEGRSEKQKSFLEARKQRRGFATGGGVGTDTVPALLTPGEFVINRKSAQAIGYGSLNRMNKVGKYAKGGIVQHFGQGTSGTGAQATSSVSSALIPSQTLIQITKRLDSLNITISEAQSGMTLLKKASPSLYKTLNDYASEANLTSKEQGKMAVAYVSTAKSLRRQGFTLNEISTTMASFGDALTLTTQKLRTSRVSDNSVLATSKSQALPPSGSSVTSSAPIGPFGSIPRQAAAAAASGGGGSGPPTQSNTQAVVNNTKAQQGAAKSAIDVVNNNKMFAASMVTSLISGFLPAVDENSSAILKMTHSFLGLATTITSVGFALEAFGIKLNSKSFMDFLGGKGNVGNQLTEKIGLNRRAIGQQANLLTVRNQAMGMSTTRARFSAVRQSAQASKDGFAFTGKGVGAFTSGLGKAAQLLTKLGGPLIAIAGSAYVVTEAFKSSIAAIYNFEGRLKSAIESGDINKATQVAGEKAGFGGANAMRAVGSTAGAGIGFVLGGPIGAAIGAALGAGLTTLVTGAISSFFGKAGDRFLAGVGTLFGGDTYNSSLALAAAQAGAVKTQKTLEQAQKTATNAMQDFENGSITAAEALTKIRLASSEVNNQEKRASDFATKNLENRGGGVSGVGRNILSFLSFGGVESVSQRNERLGKQSAEQIRQASKFQAEAFAMESPARAATIRSNFARGGKTSEQIRNEALGVGTSGDKLARLQALTSDVNRLGRAGDEEGARAAEDALKQLREEINQVDREMANLEKEVARSKAAFDAMNLGLRGPTATATAMSASMDRFAAGLEVGGNAFAANTAFLSQAVESAAQSMDPAQIKSAIDNVANNLQEMGVDPSKFRANTEAFVEAQQKYNKVFDKIRSDAQSRIRRGQGAGNTPDEIKKAFAQELTSGLGEEAKKNLTDIIKNIALSPEEVDKIIAGDLSIFGDKLGEAGKKQLEDIVKISQERQKAEQVLIDLTKKRIESEKNVFEAQKEALALQMEGREVQGKYGGVAVTNSERRANVLARANVGAAGMGLSGLRTGSAAEFRNRSTEMVRNFGGIEGKRRIDGGMAGSSGVEFANTQQELQKAQKEQIQTIRDLIKIEEDELKITQEKNRLEKQSLESLITGDIEKFLLRTCSSIRSKFSLPSIATNCFPV